MGSDRRHRGQRYQFLKIMDSLGTPRPVSLNTAIISFDKYGLFANTPHVDDEMFDEIMEKEGCTEEEILQMILNASHPGLRMYGSGRELSHNLSIFRDFPGNRKFFSTAENDMTNSTLSVMPSLRQREFVCKQDALAFIEYLIMSFYEEEAYLMTRAMTCMLIRHYERELSHCFELIPRGCFTSMVQMIVHNGKRTVLPKGTSPLSLVSYSMSEITSQWRSILNPIWKDAHHHNFYPLMESFVAKFPIKKFAPMHKMAFAACQVIFGVVRRVVEKSPRMFRPYLATKDNQMPIGIRIFDDHGERFVMCSEIQKAIVLFHHSKNNSDKVKEYQRKLDTPCEQSHDICSFVSTVSTNEMAKILKESGVEMDHIELLMCPVKRVKHAAVPIISATGDHCKLAVDVLFETLRNCIFGCQLFQVTNGDWNFVQFTLAALEPWFRTDKKSIYFLKYCQIQEIECCLSAERYQIDGKICEIRDVPKKGFTLKDLKSQLVALNLLKTFPDILDHARVAYNTVMKKKTGRVLRTCDMFDAVEHCQLLCIFHRNPKLGEFLHNQKACHRLVGFNCWRCADAADAKLETREKIQEIIVEEYLDLFVKTEKGRANKKFEKKEEGEKKASGGGCGDAVAANSKQPVSSPSVKEKTETNNAERESKCCEKCLRTSEKCNEAKEDLKMAKNRVTALEKKLSAAERNRELLRTQMEEDIRKKWEGKVDSQKEEHEKEMEELRKRVADSEQLLLEAESNLKLATTSSHETIKKLQSIIIEKEKKEIKLEELLAMEREKQKDLMRKLDSKELESWEINRIHTQNYLLHNENEQQTLEIERLKTQLLALQKSHESPPLETSLSASPDFQKMLLKLLRTRNSILSENPLKQLKEIGISFIESSDDEHIRKCAFHEMTCFEEQFSSFVKALEANIQDIQTDPSITRSELSPYPAFPSLSAPFLYEFEKLAKQKHCQHDVADGELADKECLICLQNMGSKEQTLKCQHCKRRYHDECASEWLKRKSVCPACNRALLDATEYPHLS